jgi:hypothetical protein
LQAYEGARNFPPERLFVRGGLYSDASKVSEKLAYDFVSIGRRLKEIEAEKVRLRAYLAVVMKAPKVEVRPTLSQVWISERL